MGKIKDRALGFTKKKKNIIKYEFIKSWKRKKMPCWALYSIYYKRNYLF